ncbi:hypothetical protein KP509_30G067900 [Ceratopteris richardii]|uniref:Transmembrane protein n=1 Tax=Ceratopteris richardii TaxID=49495 RepID=A0A8T2R515_CERRI|nr:hypothetical protein KP509_30G067900 [Ceratopteris richardii]
MALSNLSFASSTGFGGLAPLRSSETPAASSPAIFFCSCSSRGSDDLDSDDRKLTRTLNEASKHIVKLALAAAVTGFVALGPTGDALAAKSGGRVGGQAFRSAPPPSAGPRRSGPSSRTNIYINPPSFAPPLFGGYGSPYFGGWGWSPFYAPGPSIAVGVGGGFSFFTFFILLSFVVGIINFFRRRDDEDDYYD